jgi:aspartate/methionine/tyrosine aminotransferase
VHSPKSAQYAYTCAMEQFNEADQLNLAAYYKPMVRNVEALLQETGFAVKSANYVKRQATFYVIADFSVLYGKEMPAKLLEYYVSSTKKSVENNIDLAMYILFKYKLALMPMHFFGAKLNSGLLRITCSFESADEFTALANTIRQINADINGGQSH